MASRRAYIAGSTLVALLGIGIVIYLWRRKPETIIKTIETFVFETKVSEAAFEKPLSDMDRLIQQSNEAIAADDAQEKL